MYHGIVVLMATASHVDQKQDLKMPNESLEVC